MEYTLLDSALYYRGWYLLRFLYPFPCGPEWGFHHPRSISPSIPQSWSDGNIPKVKTDHLPFPCHPWKKAGLEIPYCWSQSDCGLRPLINEGFWCCIMSKAGAVLYGDPHGFWKTRVPYKIRQLKPASQITYSY